MRKVLCCLGDQTQGPKSGLRFQLEFMLIRRWISLINTGKGVFFAILQKKYETFSVVLISYECLQINNCNPEELIGI